MWYENDILSPACILFCIHSALLFNCTKGTPESGLHSESNLQGIKVIGAAHFIIRFQITCGNYGTCGAAANTVEVILCLLVALSSHRCSTVINGGIRFFRIQNRKESI